MVTSTNPQITKPRVTPTKHADDYDVDDVKQLADIEAMLCEISGEPRNGRWRCPTPDHEDKNPSCGIIPNSEPSLWKCHGCGSAGSVIELGGFMWPALDDRELINRVGREFSGATPGDRTAPRPQRQPSKPEPPKPVSRLEEYERARRPANMEQRLAEACAHRGWSIDTAHAWCCEVVLGRNGVPALRMPHVFNATVVGWKDRYLDDDGSPVTKKQALALGVPPHDSHTGTIAVPFGADRLDAQMFPSKSLFIVEGEADAITITEVLDAATPVLGVPGANNVKDHWLQAVDAWQRHDGGRSVFVLTDNDEPGEQLRERLSAHLAHCRHLDVPADHNDVSEWLQASTARLVADELRRQARAATKEVAA